MRAPATGIAPFEAGESLGAEAQVGKIKAAMRWLREQMHDGQPGRAADLERQALAQGIPHSTLAEARRRLAIRAEKRGAAWWWIPPGEARTRARAVTGNIQEDPN